MKNGKKDKFKTGDAQWHAAVIYDRWQRLRRNPEYIAACDTIPFGDHGMVIDRLLMNHTTYDKLPEIKGQFGLETIYAPWLDISTRDIFLMPAIFKNDLAVQMERKVKNKEIGVDENGDYENDDMTPIYDDHFIRLTVNVHPDIRMEQILSEIKENVESARINLDKEMLAKIEKDRIHLNKRRICYDVWDKRRLRKSFVEIARELGLKSKNLAKQKFYTAYELIIGEKYDINQFKQLLNSISLSQITDQHSKEAFIKQDEIKLKEQLGFKDTIATDFNQLPNSVYDGESTLFLDINKHCEKCTDLECKSYLASQDFDNWVPCPDVYAILDEYHKS